MPGIGRMIVVVYTFEVAWRWFAAMFKLAVFVVVAVVVTVMDAVRFLFRRR
jgi:uncharacterized membrane protein YqjE